MTHALSERSYWILAVSCLALSVVLLDVGWTSPFAYQLYSQLGIAWLSLPWIDAIISITAVVAFIFGLWLLTRTKDPTRNLSGH
jgi:hypothetical protein